MSSIPGFVTYTGIALAALGVSTFGAPLAAAEDPPNCTGRSAGRDLRCGGLRIGLPAHTPRGE